MISLYVLNRLTFFVIQLLTTLTLVMVAMSLAHGTSLLTDWHLTSLIQVSLVIISWLWTLIVFHLLALSYSLGFSEPLRIHKPQQQKRKASALKFFLLKWLFILAGALAMFWYRDSERLILSVICGISLGFMGFVLSVYLDHQLTLKEAKKDPHSNMLD